MSASGRMGSAWDGVDPGQAGLRWGGGFAVVAALFAALFWVVLHWVPKIATPPAPPPAAVMIDLSPLPAAPQAPPQQTPLGPQQTLSQPPPPQQVVQQKLPDAPPAPAPQVAVPVPPKAQPKREEHHKPVVHRILPKPLPEKTPPATQTTAPPQTQAPPAPASAPASPSATSEPPSNAVPSWQSAILSRLERYKRYPALAQERDEQGAPYVRFTMDRDGNVLNVELVKSSGYADLDDEAVALPRRASPLPKPPAEMPGDPITLTVPVQFFMQDDGD